MALYSKMVPKPNQNFVENGQQPTRQLLPGRPARLAEEPAVWLPARLQRVGEGSVLLPHQRHHVPRIRERLDLPGRGSGAADPLGRPVALPVVVHRHVDAGDGIDRARHARSRPIASTRSTSSAGSSKYKPTDVGLPSYLDDFCSTSGGCTLPSITIGVGPALSAVRRRAVGRRHRHAHAGAVVADLGEGPPHAARRHRRPARAARPHRRRQPFGSAQLRPHLYAAVQRRVHVDAEQPRAVAGRLRTGAADVGVDQRHGAIELQQLLDGRVRPGHVATGAVHAQYGPAVRVRDRREGERTAR